MALSLRIREGLTKGLFSSYNTISMLSLGTALSQIGNNAEELQQNTYILLHVLLCSIAEYFYEFCRILASL